MEKPLEEMSEKEIEELKAALLEESWAEWKEMSLPLALHYLQSQGDDWRILKLSDMVKFRMQAGLARCSNCASEGGMGFGNEICLDCSADKDS